MEYRKQDYLISTDKAKLDISVIHNFLKGTYWAKNVPMEIVKRSIENSICFGVYYQDNQIGFTRVVTDYSTCAYIADVFILNEFRGKGLSKWLMEVIMNYPELQNLKRWMLGTKDAHGLYARFGFTSPQHPDWLMENTDLDIYIDKSKN
ncbi:acetyltransferase (GNAT) family protein [bacterium BMS3Abin04]|nr:acetyltransferase (GNAT) family protein [bacterium BMS3Abin04]